MSGPLRATQSVALSKRNARRKTAARDGDYSPTRGARARRTHGRAAVAIHNPRAFDKPRPGKFDAAGRGPDGLILLGLGIYNARRRIRMGARLTRG